MRRVVGWGFGRGHLRREIDEELAFHIQMRTEQLVAAGLSGDEARREALRQFGDLHGTAESCITLDRERERAMSRAHFFDELRHDVVYAARTLRRNLGVTVIVVVTLALGIGANTAIFTLVNAVLLRTLPVRTPEELVVIGDPSRIGGMSYSSNPRPDLISFKTYKELVKRNHVATGILASGRVDRFDVLLESSATEPLRPRGRFVSGNYFSVLGVPAMLGRTFDGSEDASIGGSPVVVVSHSFWTRHLAADSAAVGKDIRINGARFTIIGVTPPWFTGEIVGQSLDIWAPVTMQAVVSPNRPFLEDPEAYWLVLLARRAPGVTFEQAKSEFTTLWSQILTEQSTSATTAASVPSVRVAVSPGAKGFSRVRQSYEAPLLTLMVGVGLLLLIICANVANMLLARAIARSKEMSVRLAIGAGRWRLVRQLLTESALLALIGAAAGLFVARYGSRLLLTLVADGQSAIPIDARLDLPVLAFTMLLSVVAIAAFGLVPALRASRVDLASTMRANAKAVTGGALGGKGQRMPLGRLLISAQVALSLVLLMGAALLVKNLRGLQRIATGLDRDHLVVIEVDASARSYTEDRLASLARELAAGFERLPGVAAASFSENGIFSGTESSSNVGVPGFVAREANDSIANFDQAGPGFVRATGARLLAGRDFLPSDVAGGQPVAMVNETFARFYFPGDNAIGRNVRVGGSTSVQIVGVLADVKDRELVAPPVRRMYLPYLQRLGGDPGALRFLVRTKGDPRAQLASLRSTIVSVDPQLPIDNLAPLATMMRSSIREERLLTKLATGFGVVALLLAAVGLYGVMTYAIARRTGEIGLRVALGAQRRDVVRMILGDAMRLVGLGLVLGVPLGVAAGELLKGQLHDVKPADPAAITGALLVLIASGVTAALLPALRAARVAPTEALREE